jgi:hypothetical protein
MPASACTNEGAYAAGASAGPVSQADEPIPRSLVASARIYSKCKPMSPCRTRQIMETLEFPCAAAVVHIRLIIRKLDSCILRSIVHLQSIYCTSRWMFKALRICAVETAQRTADQDGQRYKFKGSMSFLCDNDASDLARVCQNQCHMARRLYLLYQDDVEWFHFSPSGCKDLQPPLRHIR